MSMRFKFHKNRNKLTYFSDDVTFLVKDINSIERTLIIKNMFAEFFSSLKINVNGKHVSWVNRKTAQTHQLT